MIPRYNNSRTRNRSGSTKSSHAGFLGSGSVSNYNFGRSSSFRVHRSTSGSLPGGGGGTPSTTDFCKHIKYCCLHQNFNSARNVVIGDSLLEKQSNNQLSDFNRCDQDSQEDVGRGKKGMGGASSNSLLGNRFNMNEYTNYSNYSDDEKSVKFNNQFLADPAQQQNVPPYETTTSFSNGEFFLSFPYLTYCNIVNSEFYDV